MRVPVAPLPFPLVFALELTRDEQGWFGHFVHGAGPHLALGAGFNLGPDPDGCPPGHFTQRLEDWKGLPQNN